MKTTFLILLYAAVFWAAFHAVYWRIFRPIVLTRLRFRLFAARDTLRELVIAGLLDQKDEVYSVLEHGCKCCIHLLERLTILEIIFAPVQEQHSLKAHKEWQQIAQARAEVRQVHKNLVSIMMGAAFLNSPGLLPFLGIMAIVVITSLWFGKMKRTIEETLVRSWALLYAPAG